MERFLGMLILVGAVALIAGGIAVKDSIESYWRSNDLAAIANDQEVAVFETKIAAYAEQKWDSATQKRNVLIKKIIIVDVASKKNDEMNASLPESMRASNIEEIDAVVLLRRGEERVASYTDGAAGFRRTTSVSVFRPNGESVCPSKEFKGSEPPQSKRGRGSKAYGEEPKQAAISYIQSCVEKPI